MDDDFDDLLGTPAPAQEDESDEDFDDLFDDDEPEVEYARGIGSKGFNKSLTATHVDRALKGAPPIWFAKLLGIGRTTVQRKLEHLTPRVVGNGTKLYDPREALPYLVQPYDLKKHIAQMNPRDLPERLRKEYWTARKVEQQVRRESGDLWHSSDVAKSFGDILKLVKDTAILWADTIDESVGLTSPQITLLDDLVRDLLTQVADKVEQYANGDVTLSHEAEYADDEEL